MLVDRWFCSQRGDLTLPSLSKIFLTSIAQKQLIPRDGALSCTALCFITLESRCFTGSRAHGAVSNTFFTAVDQIPIDRRAGQAATSALGKVPRVLTRGEGFLPMPRASGRGSRDTIGVAPGPTG